MPFAPNLVIHPVTRKHLDSFLKSPAHAVILYGEDGVGLTSIATELAVILSPSQPQIEIAPIDGKDISIDQIRTLYSATQSVESSGKVVVIDDAHTMSNAAQNAFLKLLEEPPARVHFILVAHDKNTLLPTIQSRTEVINILNVPHAAMKSFIDSLTADTTLHAQLGFLAGGLPAKAKRLVDTPEILQSTGDMTRDARTFLQGEYYDRLLLANKYAGNRESAIDFVTMVGQLLIHTLRRQTDQSSKLESIARTIDRLHQNSNVKLQMIDLSLGL